MSRPTFQENLREFLKASGMSQAELAFRVDVTGGAVSRWFKKDELPSGQALLAVAKVLGVDVWLLVGSSFKEPKPPRNVAPPGRRPKATPRDEVVAQALEPTPKRPAAVRLVTPTPTKDKRTRAD